MVKPTVERMRTLSLPLPRVVTGHAQIVTLISQWSSYFSQLSRR
jgi:hypothetical protein